MKEMSNISDIVNAKVSKKDRKELIELSNSFRNCMITIKSDCIDANNCKRFIDHLEKLKIICAKLDTAINDIRGMIGIIERYEDE